MDKVFILQVSANGFYATVMCPPASLQCAGTVQDCLEFLDHAVHEDDSTSVNK